MTINYIYSFSNLEIWSGLSSDLDASPALSLHQDHGDYGDRDSLLIMSGTDSSEGICYAGFAES